MSVDAYEKTGNNKDLGSRFLTEEEKAELAKARAKETKVKKEKPKKKKK